MSYTVKTTKFFERAAKRLLKKYTSLEAELIRLNEVLSDKPDLGQPLGNSVFKIRIGIASKGKGKRGGARVITYYKDAKGIVYLLTIYEKGAKDNISDVEISEILISEPC